jgi:hypothetical protein
LKFKKCEKARQSCRALLFGTLLPAAMAMTTPTALSMNAFPELFAAPFRTDRAVLTSSLSQIVRKQLARKLG